MQLWLNVETAQWVLSWLCDRPGVPEAWDWSWVTWRVCPECCFVEPQHQVYDCPRPKGELNSYGGAFGKPGFTELCRAQTVPLPKALNDSLWSALRLGGTNAVVEILTRTKPEDVGLEPAIKKLRDRWARQDRRRRGGP